MGLEIVNQVALGDNHKPAMANFGWKICRNQIVIRIEGIKGWLSRRKISSRKEVERDKL